MAQKITVLPGDGIGVEVTDAAVSFLSAVAEKHQLDLSISVKLVGGSSFDKFGTPLTVDTLNECFQSDAVLLGAVGGPKWESLPHDKKPEAALLQLRKALGLYNNLRPAKVYNALIKSSTIKAEVIENVDLIVVRELTGGLYFGEPRGMDSHRAFNTMAYTVEEIERIAKAGFELAMKRNKKLCSVDKANVLEVSQLWRNVVKQVHRNYPEVALTHMYVDNAAMQLVRNPSQFDVMLTENMFGDILSDIASMIPGSLGMLPSASLGTKYALYEPVHGSAPDIAGQNKANPIGTIASLAMMFEYTFGLKTASEQIEKAIVRTLNEGYRTADIYTAGTTLVTTSEMADRIKGAFLEIYETNNYGFAYVC